MNKTLKWILIALGVAVAGLILLKIIKGKGEDGIKVTADVVKKNTIVESVSASGKIYPELEVKVGSGITGEVTELYVQEGDTVKKGQVLARVRTESNRTATPRIDPTNLNNLVQAMQNPPQARATNSTITSPIAGIVSSLNIKKGERVGTMTMQGSEILRVADMSAMEVRVDVNENDIIKVNVGDSADVEVEAYSKRKFKGIVTYIANTVSRKEAAFMNNDITSYEVHIRIDTSSYNDLIKEGRKMPFRSGMNARADIKTNKKSGVISVPVGAVASRVKDRDEKIEITQSNESEDYNQNDLEEVVFVIDAQNKVLRRTVATGIQDMFNMEIVNGLKEGEKIVTGPYTVVSKTLKNGSKINVVSKETVFEKE